MALALALVMIHVEGVVVYSQHSVYILRRRVVKDHYP
jgi:hypothetical protein